MTSLGEGRLHLIFCRPQMIRSWARSPICLLNKYLNPMQKEKSFAKALGISMIVCRNPLTKKYLVIQECDESWWIPGGRVDAPETFCQAGIRECKEEAGVDVKIMGILRMEQSLRPDYARLKSILYAEPIDPKQTPKELRDSESIQGKYMSLEQILEIRKQWREESIYVWPKYLEDGGRIYPLSMLKETPIPDK